VKNIKPVDTLGKQLRFYPTDQLGRVAGARGRWGTCKIKIWRKYGMEKKQKN